MHGELDRSLISKSYREVSNWQAHGRDLERYAIAQGYPSIKVWLETPGRT
jgi:hypothetical protein